RAEAHADGRECDVATIAANSDDEEGTFKESWRECRLEALDESLCLEEVGHDAMWRRAARPRFADPRHLARVGTVLELHAGNYATVLDEYPSSLIVVNFGPPRASLLW